MDTVVVVIVLITLLVLFGGAAWFFIRETGVENAKLWLTSPRQVRQIVMPFRSSTSEEPGDERAGGPETLSPSHQAMERQLMLADTRLRELAEELRGDLSRAAGVTREFDTRLTRLEEEINATRSLPEAVDRTVLEVEERTTRRISKLRTRLDTVRRAESAYGTRRSEAISRLYGRLARTEAALAAVVNPMLLPGEPLRVPETLFDDTLVWDNWADVGERAYEFGETFNQDRLLLEPDTAGRIEDFIRTLREVLTDTIYPVVRHNSPTPAQKAQLRNGLVRAVDSIAPIRRELEDAYRAAAADGITDDDEDDEDERGRTLP